MTSVSSQLLFQALVNGVLTGSLFGLIATGLTLVWGVMKIVNFAHGEFLMVGLYLVYFLVASAGLDPYVTLLISPVVMFVLGAVMYQAFIRPVLRAPSMNQILLTLGLSLVIQSLALAIFSADILFAPTRYGQYVLRYGVVVVDLPRVVAALVAAVAAGALYWLLQRTDLGRSIRAVAQDPDAAALMGIDVARTNLVAFGLATATLGVAASVMSPFYYVSPTVGLLLGLFAFVVVVLGGLGNIVGAVLGGLVIGLVESVGSALMPGSLARVVTFGLFVLMVLLRPQGLFGRVDR